MSPFNVKKRFFFFSIAFCTLCIFSCENLNTEGKTNVKPYFFPLEQLGKQGIVFAYDATNTPEGVKNTEYWYRQLLKTDSATYLISTLYGPTLQQGLNSIDRITESGTVLTSIKFHEMDTVLGKLTAIDGVIESGSNFPFRVSDSTGLYVYNVKYHPLHDPESWIYFIKNTRYFGKGKPFDFKGKTQPTIVFKSKEVTGNDKEGAAEIHGKSEQRWAQGLGLVEYKRDFGGYKQAYILTDTFSMDELLKRARNKF